MYRKEVNDQSPLRILEKSIHGGLGKGNLGVVFAPAGVGKTACLVQIGLDSLMQEKDVLHVAIGQTVEHVSAWYDALFDDLASRTQLDDRDSVRGSVSRHRVIKAFAENAFTMQRLEEALELFSRHMKLKPDAILVDGFNWAGEKAAQDIETLRACSKRLATELWMSATTPRIASPRSTLLPAPCESFDPLIDVALFLEPCGSHVAVRLIKDHGKAPTSEIHLELHCDTLRLVAKGETPTPKSMPANGFTLLSGGAIGAEAEFGACAEQWGLAEVHFSFAGRGTIERTRGVVELKDEELKHGDVSASYLKAHMHRVYPDSPLFRKVLQSIWHQVSTAGEVFSVGQIMPDGTVKGGTGWAVQLAIHWGKPVFVYDQEKRSWFTWSGSAWDKALDPVIVRDRFAGAGTRFLTDDGKAAIRSLFERSFGAGAKSKNA